MHIRCYAGSRNQILQLVIDESQVTARSLVRCKIKQWNEWIDEQRCTRWHICLHSFLSIEVVQCTYDLTMYKSGILPTPTVSSTIDPFQDLSCISEKPSVQATAYPQFVERWTFIKQSTQGTEHTRVWLSSGGGFLGQLSIIAPRTSVRGRPRRYVLHALFSDEQTARVGDQVRILLVAWIAKMHGPMINGYCSQRDCYHRALVFITQ